MVQTDQILLQIVIPSTGNNYHLFRGGKDESGKTSGNKKNHVWQMLSDLIKRNGILVERTPHHVGMKINKMEAEYRKTNDWINQTGQGIIDEGGNITDAINKRCSYFYLLEPIMVDRPGTNPLVVKEAGIYEDEVGDMDSGLSTSHQLAGGGASIALVDESPVSIFRWKMNLLPLHLVVPIIAEKGQLVFSQRWQEEVVSWSL
jgi:hypothetical protein